MILHNLSTIFTNYYILVLLDTKNEPHSSCHKKGTLVNLFATKVPI